MASMKISALGAGAPAQATDLFPLARGGANYSLQMSDLLGGTGASSIVYSVNGVPTQATGMTFAAGALASLTASGTVTGGGATPFVSSSSQAGVTVASSVTNTSSSGYSGFLAYNNTPKSLAIQMFGSAVASYGDIPASAAAVHTDSTAGLFVGTSSATSIFFITSIKKQLEIVDFGVGTTRWVKISGSSASPSISTSAGDLTLAPASAVTAVTGALNVSAPVKPGGYAIGSLPAGAAGQIAYVTDQITAPAAKGVAPTAGGAIVCAVIFDGTIWVGI